MQQEPPAIAGRVSFSSSHGIYMFTIIMITVIVFIARLFLGFMKKLLFPFLAAAITFIPISLSGCESKIKDVPTDGTSKDNGQNHGGHNH